MKIRSIFLLTIFSIIALVTSGCEQVAGTPPREGKVVMALFDVSDTTKEDEVRRMYMNGFKRVLERIEPGDVIVADVITDNPLATATFPINEEFAAFDPLTQNPLVQRKRLEQQRDSVLKKAEEILFFPRDAVKRTKILDAASLAGRVFETYKRTKRVLVVFSDMVEESDFYNFQRQPLNESAVRQIIAKEKQTGRIPNLTGVNVYVVGAAAGAYSGSSSQRFMDIEHFWIAYFREAGADLAESKYGAGLLDFGE